MVAVEPSLAALLERCRAFRDRYEGQVALLDADGLRALLDELDGLWNDLSRLAAYATLDGAEEAEGADDAFARAQELLRFTDLEWLAVPDERARALLRERPLAPYRHVLEARRRFRPHALSPAEERALAARDPAAEEAWIALYDLARAQVLVPFRGRTCTLDALLGHLRHPDGEVRAAALETIGSALEPLLPTIAHCYDTLVADRLVLDELRGFASPRASTELEHELPSALVDRMLDAVERRSELAHDWFGRKARLLGSRLTVADEHAPLGGEQSVSLDEALAVVVEAFGRLAPELGALVLEFVDEGRIDAEPRPEKTGTGFCLSVARDVKPYVLLNYRARPSDVLKLAHELGHAVHLVLAGRAQTALSFEAPLPVGEVAAALAQLVVADELVEREPDPEARLGLVGGRLETSLEAVFRQVALTRFEEEACRVRAAGEPLGPERLEELWLEAGRRYYGPAVELTDGYRSLWACVGHLFHGRFYNCAYVFAHLTGLVLRRHAVESPGFGERYVRFLERGGSQDPLAQLDGLGVDLGREDVWDVALSELRSMLAEAPA